MLHLGKLGDFVAFYLIFEISFQGKLLQTLFFENLHVVGLAFFVLAQECNSLYFHGSVTSWLH